MSGGDAETVPAALSGGCGSRAFRGGAISAVDLKVWEGPPALTFSAQKGAGSAVRSWNVGSRVAVDPRFEKRGFYL